MKNKVRVDVDLNGVKATIERSLDLPLEVYSKGLRTKLQVGDKTITPLLVVDEYDAVEGVVCLKSERVCKVSGLDDPCDVKRFMGALESSEWSIVSHRETVGLDLKKLPILPLICGVLICIHNLYLAGWDFDNVKYADTYAQLSIGVAFTLFLLAFLPCLKVSRSA